MKTNVGRVAWDCFVDLGVTVVYATIAGLLIVGIVATDDGPGSIFLSAVYASLLPLAVMLLIGFDVVLRVFADRRATRQRAAGRPHAGHGRPAGYALSRS